MSDQKDDKRPAFELHDLPDLPVGGCARSLIGLRGEKRSEAPAVARRFGAVFDGDVVGPPTYDEWLPRQPLPAELGLGDTERSALMQSGGH